LIVSAAPVNCSDPLALKVATGLTAAVAVEFGYPDTVGLAPRELAGVEYAAGRLEEEGVTGQRVVYSAMISVVTFPILPGQLVIVGAQDVIVYTDVE